MYGGRTRFVFSDRRRYHFGPFLGVNIGQYVHPGPEVQENRFVGKRTYLEKETWKTN